MFDARKVTVKRRSGVRVSQWNREKYFLVKSIEGTTPYSRQKYGSIYKTWKLHLS